VRRPQLTWAAVQNAGSYRVQVVLTPDFSVLVLDTTAAGTQHTPTDALAPSTLH
jgi:hypothetical protein